MTTQPAQMTTVDAKFDRIIDAITTIADEGSIDGKFSYHTRERPHGRFAVTLDGVVYEVSIAPKLP